MPNIIRTISRKTVVQTETSSVDMELLVNKKIGLVFYGLVAVFWLGQLWCSPYASFDNNMDTGNPYGHHLNPLMRIADRILDEPSLVGKRFSLYEVSLVVLAFYVLISFKDFMRRERFESILFFISLLVVLISLLNPNNSFDKTKYLITGDPRKLYVYLLFLYTFIFIRSDVLAVILKKFFAIGAYAAILLAAYSLFFFLIGKGPIFYGNMTTLPNSEHLDWMIIFSSIFLALYFNSRKKSYLTYVILFHLVVIFGDRRTETAVLIASDLMFLAYYLKDNIFVRSTKFIVPGTILALIVFPIVWIANIDIIYFFERFYTIFFPQKYYDGWFSDAGHWDQTATTFKTLFANLDKFWGAGMRNEMNYVEGQSGYIHNSFVVVWSIYGLHMTMFYIFLFLLFLKESLSLYFGKVNESNMITASVTFSYFMIIIGSAFTGEFIFKHFVYATQFVLIVCILKIGKHNMVFSTSKKISS